MTIITLANGTKIEADATELPAILIALGIGEQPTAVPAPELPAERMRVDFNLDDDDDPEPLTLASVTHMTTPVIPLNRNLREVLDIVLQFPEGISREGIHTLMKPGTKPGSAGNRLYRLKLMGLVEKLTGHWQWVPTDLARRAKVIAA